MAWNRDEPFEVDSLSRERALAGFVRLNENRVGVYCGRCNASAPAESIGAISMPSLQGEAVADTSALVVILLAVAFVVGVGVVAARLHFPCTVALLIASFPLTVTAIQLRFTSVVQWLFLPTLVFEAAWNLQLGTLRRVWPAVALLAPDGVFATAFIVGAGLALAKVHKDALEQAHAVTVGRCRETLVKRR